jgi:hypothetical protein
MTEHPNIRRELEIETEDDRRAIKLLSEAIYRLAMVRAEDAPLCQLAREIEVHVDAISARFNGGADPQA